MTKIYLNTNFLTLTDINNFNQLLNDHMHVLDLCIDLTGIKFCDPQSILLLAVLLRKFDRFRVDLQTEVIIDENSRVIGYLAHIGFFEFIGLNYGNKLGQASGGQTYIPIREIDIRKLNQISFNTGQTLQDLISEEAQDLARILVGSISNRQIYLTLAFAIRESIRNALEHSEQQCCYICAQKWSNGKAQFAVIDEGIGIFESLSRSAVNFEQDNFLELAIEPGLTRTLHLSDTDNIHENSGFGLYILKTLADNYGRMTLSSSNKTLVVKKGQTINIIKDIDYMGTLISLEFNVYPNDMQDVLKMIVDCGEEEAREAGRTSKASRRSRSL